MRDVVIVSVARTPIGKAFKGAFNDTEAPALSGHVAAQAVARAGLDPARIEDVIIGCSAQQGTQGYNIGRLTAAAAGFGQGVPGMSVDRMCASGLMAVAIGARQILHDGMDVVVAGGVESISLVQNKFKNTHRNLSSAVIAQLPHMYMPMIETAEIVAERYNISRDAQDAFAQASHLRPERLVPGQHRGAPKPRHSLSRRAVFRGICAVCRRGSWRRGDCPEPASAGLCRSVRRGSRSWHPHRLGTYRLGHFAHSGQRACRAGGRARGCWAVA
jgi:hypothetical protein